MPPIDLQAVCRAIGSNTTPIAECTQELTQQFSATVAGSGCEIAAEPVACAADQVRRSASAAASLLKDEVLQRWERLRILPRAVVARVLTERAADKSRAPNTRFGQSSATKNLETDGRSSLRAIFSFFTGFGPCPHESHDQRDLSAYGLFFGNVDN